MKLTRLDYTIAGLAFALMLTALPACQPIPKSRNLYLECKIGNTPSFTYDQPAVKIYEHNGKWRIITHSLVDGVNTAGVYKQKQGELCIVVKRDGEVI